MALMQILQYYTDKSSGNIADVLLTSGMFRDLLQFMMRFKEQV